jgi:hypothetical protein
VWSDVDTRRWVAVCVCVAALFGSAETRAAGQKLYGVHWWDYSNPSVGSGPDGGWSVETVVTNSDPWWQAPFFVPLYQQVTSTHDAEIVTRLDFNWGETVPAPTSSSAQDWANKIVSDVIGPLGSYAHRWIIGNEPNIVSEGNGWSSNQIFPTDYAQIYQTVRQTIRAQRPNDEILFAPVSPGGVIPGVRWKSGNQWLSEAIDATLALPGGAIDGFAIHAYGNPFTSAAQAVAEFHDSYTSQLAIIDARQLTQVPVYITEWNRATSTSGNLAANEQVTADFLRMSLLDVDAWNRMPGDHNIRSLTWFVYNKDYGDAWNQYSLEWWQSQGNPVGDDGDLWTALMNGSSLLAGLVGTRPAADYNGDGVVTDADFEAWAANFGRNDWVYADGNRDGLVDASDYVLWRKSTAGFAAGTLISVPECGTAGDLMMGIVVIAAASCCCRVRRRSLEYVVLGLLFVAGCSGQPRAVDVVDIDPSGAAHKAIASCDKDGDGKLSDEELKAIPGILKWKQLYDLNGDKFVSEDEITQRLRKWQSDKLGFRSIGLSVTLNGRPVPNVHVQLTPEPYLGDAVKPATGTTNKFGFAGLSVAAEDLPVAIKRRGIKISGVYPGTYKVTLSGAQVQLPTVDSNGIPLGDEVARDTVDSSIEITLKSH